MPPDIVRRNTKRVWRAEPIPQANSALTGWLSPLLIGIGYSTFRGYCARLQSLK
nr:hypothetical protein [Klebsiella pneumoniae]